MKQSLSDMLEYAILDFVRSFDQGKHQASWSEWDQQAHRTVPGPFQAIELQAAFQRLQAKGILHLSKYSGGPHPSEYPGNEQDAQAFFFSGPFIATITPTGRKHWDQLNARIGNGVFISHITQEKPVALVLKKYLNLAFGDAFRVFVSSDARSIGGGTKWYNYIIENLRISEVVLVLVSQESKGREWINFEAGVGEGLESLVIPVAINNLSPGQMSYPLLGVQGRSIHEIGPILEDIGNRISCTPNTIDATAYLSDIEDAEAHLSYKSLRVEPVVEGRDLQFDIQNVGNIDLELLMLEVYVPLDHCCPN